MAAAAGLVLLDQAVPWVAGRIWWIGGTMAACFILAVAAGMWLESWTARRAARWGAARGIVSRAEYIAPYRVRAEVADAARPAIAPPSFTVNIFGQPTTEQAEVIRQALNGRSGT